MYISNTFQVFNTDYKQMFNLSYFLCWSYVSEREKEIYKYYNNKKKLNFFVFIFNEVKHLFVIYGYIYG